jgi:leader peptidase (prepilin peptidase)/N-methyltransferase
MSLVPSATAFLVVLLAIATLIDVRTLRIPNFLNALIVVAGLSAAWLLDRSMLAAVIGVVAGYSSLATVNYAYRRARGRDGVGLGDAKLLAGAGAWLGWTGLPFVVLIASALGLVFVAAARIAGRTLGPTQAIPFGPFLCVGILCVWLVQTYR